MPPARVFPDHIARVLERRLLHTFGRWDELEQWTRQYGRLVGNEAAFLLHRTFLSDVQSKGITPSMHRLQALAAALGVSLGQTYKFFRLDLDALPRLQAMLHRQRTHPVRTAIFNPENSIRLPILPASPVERNMYLSDIALGWIDVAAGVLAHWRDRRSVRYVRIGLGDGTSYPFLPPGAYVQIEPVKSRLPLESFDPDTYYLVSHRFGYSCCKCFLENRNLFLQPSKESGYPTLEVSYPDHAHVLGRATALVSRVDGLTGPPPFASVPLRQTGPLVEDWEYRKYPGNELIQRLRQRWGFSFADMDEMGRQLTGFSLSLSGSYVQSLETSDRPLHAKTAMALAAALNVHFGDLLAHYGLRLDPRVHPGQPAHYLWPETEPPVRPAGAFADRLLARWHELPALLWQLGFDLSRTALVYIRDPHGMAPILKPDAFLWIHRWTPDERSRVREIVGNWSVWQNDWERRIFLVRTPAGLRCSYCRFIGDDLHLVPHPSLSSVPTEAFSYPRDIEIEGHVLGVATPLSPPPPPEQYVMDRR